MFLKKRNISKTFMGLLVSTVGFCLMPISIILGTIVFWSGVLISYID